jgi:hypothetical protein
VAGVVGIGWRQSTLRLGRDRTLAHLAAVRDVIEHGAMHLNRVAYALDPVKQDCRATPRPNWSNQVTQEFAEANAAVLDAFRCR